MGNIVELKARAYDCFVQIDILQRELAKVNQEIVKEIDKQNEKINEKINEKANGNQNDNPKQ